MKLFDKFYDKDNNKYILVVEITEESYIVIHYDQNGHVPDSYVFESFADYFEDHCENIDKFPWE